MLRYFELVRYQVYANLKAEVARGGLGILWWILDPVLYMCVFYIVFQYILSRGGVGYVPFLLTGMSVWKWFASSVSTGTSSIYAGGGLMKQLHLKKCVFPLVSLLTNTFKFLIILVILIAFMLIIDIPPSFSWLSLPLIILVQFLFLLAIVGILAAIYPFFPDMKIVIDNALALGLFVSGTFYEVRDVAGTLKHVLMFNPMAVLIINYRDVLIHGLWPNWAYLTCLSLISLLGIYCAYKIIDRFERIYPKIIS